MSKITVLDQNTINQIAAGEVIERPAAVVKELVENAIDAGANAVTVEIKDGGISFIRITDNGSGIEEEDMPFVFLRHSTSKIKTAEDLLSVTSLGFRGEALSSIAAIAQVELVTKTSSSFTGIRYVIAGGEEKSTEHIGCPGGTTFIIRNLFFNTPARKKFLKSAVTEAGYISDLLERLSVSHPNISFKYINNNQVKLYTTGNNNLKDILYNVYGRDITPQLVEVKGSNKQVSITGFIAKPVVSRGNRNYENYFINGRYIKSNLINKAIEEAYRPYIMLHRYPFTSLHIQIESELIDVNVHPAKLEIRFKNGEELYRLIYHTIKTALEGKELIPDVTLTDRENKVKVQQKIPEPFEEKRRIENNENTRNYQNASSNEYARNHENIKNNESAINNKQARYSENNENIGMPANSNKSGQQTPYHYQYSGNSTTVDNDNSRYNTPENRELIKDTEIGKLHEVVTTASDIIKESSQYPERNERIYTSDNNDSTEYSTINETFDNTGLRDKVENSNEKEVLQSAQERNDNKSDEISQDKLVNLNKTGNSTVVDKPQQLSFLSEEAKKNHRIVGQVFSTYWIVEFGDKMFLIDQHAAHEKVLYEKTMNAFRNKQFHSQLLEPPIILTLSPSEEEAFNNFNAYLEQIGFEIEEFGGKEYAVRAVPSDLYGLAQSEILIELIDGLIDEGCHETPEMILEKVASISCKAAVKGNNRLSVEEANNLIDQLMTLDNPYHCPHGRPTIVSMSKYEIEKKFKRIV